MKYVVVKTETEFNSSARDRVNCDVSIHDDLDFVIDKARMTYSKIVSDAATKGDLIATSYETCGDLIVEAKVFGEQKVVIIVVKKVDEN